MPLVNRSLCYIDNECPKELYKILDSHKCFDYEKDGNIYKICSLIFNGLPSLDNETNRELFTDKFFIGISEEMYETTCFEVDIILKDFDECLELPENFEEMNKEDNIIIDIIINGDIEAKDFVLKIYGNEYICSNGNRYIRDGNIWTYNKENVGRVFDE